MLKRHIAKKFLELQNNYPIVLLTGPRQVGKTTLLKNLKEENRKYVTLDDPIIRENAINNPSTFLKIYSPPVIIDEIQYAPNLLSYIKMYVDEHQNNGDFWLTGSQIFHLMSNVSESLAGRIGILNLQSLSKSEIDESFNISFVPNENTLLELNTRKLSNASIFEYIFKGGMPRLITNNDMDVTEYCSSYINTYIERDIRSLTQVADEMTFFKFLRIVAARTGNILNYNEISKEVGVTIPTIKQWISVLVSSGIVYLLEPYSNNVLQRAIKTPKIYFLDTALCAYLTYIESPKTLENNVLSGAFFETWVISEIIKSYYNVGKRPPIYFYRDKDAKEIDLLIINDGKIHPIEIKKNDMPDKNATKNFNVLDKINIEVGDGAIICNCENLSKIKDNLWLVPVKII